VDSGKLLASAVKKRTVLFTDIIDSTGRAAEMVTGSGTRCSIGTTKRDHQAGA